jgi:hypothetical protein
MEENLHKPAEDLLAVMDIVSQHAPEDIAQRFCNAVDDYFENPNIKTLDEALQLCAHKQGSSPSKKLYRTHKRNQLIHQAHGLLEMDRTKASKKLARIANEFQLSTWPDVRNLEEPPEEWSQLRKCIFKAYKYKPSFPKWRQVDAIVSSLQKPPACSRNDIVNIWFRT